MPPILNAQSLSKRYGARPLFENISLVVSDGDRIGLIGPNGAGKSTLLQVLAGREDADSGDVAVRKRTRVATVLQSSEFASGKSVRAVLETALRDAGVREAEHEQRLREMMGRIGFPDESAEAAKLSGGWRKRLAIAEAVITEPDVLLLDEPTNHLDLAGIEWLEELLAGLRCACVVVSHDRYFLEAVATDVVELNRRYAGGAFRVRGNYSRFLEERELHLESETKQQASLRNRVKTEVEWLRRGPKARTTKSKARIDRAQEMIVDLREMNARTSTSTAGIGFAATERETKRLLTLKDVRCELGGETIVEGLTFTITAGARVGLVGPNGSGKTTLMRLMEGSLQPVSGTVERAPNLRIVHFLQTREIDLKLTLRDALIPQGDTVVFGGRQVHVASWASRFLFTGEQLNQPVERLSGGERARVLIARMMLQPADLLLLDEPTNDLDIPTLEVLEQSLLEYPGALVLVTHDRYLLNRVSTQVLGLDGTGRAETFADYSQWENWNALPKSDKPMAAEREAAAVVAPAAKKRLSYLEQREWSTLEERIRAAEKRKASADAALESDAIATDAAALQRALTEQSEIAVEVEGLYARWEELAQRADA